MDAMAENEETGRRHLASVRPPARAFHWLAPVALEPWRREPSPRLSANALRPSAAPASLGHPERRATRAQRSDATAAFIVLELILTALVALAAVMTVCVALAAAGVFHGGTP